MWYFQFLSLVSSGSIFFLSRSCEPPHANGDFHTWGIRVKLKNPWQRSQWQQILFCRSGVLNPFLPKLKCTHIITFFVVIVRVLLTQWYLLRWFSYIMQKIKKIQALVQNLILKPLQKVKKIRPNPCAGGPEVWRQTTAERNSGRQPIFYIT